MFIYKKIPLSVGVIFSKSGELLPHTVIFNGEKFPIEKILSRRNRCPLVVPAIAPIEYTVKIEGEEKRIYFEKDSGKWFSVRKERVVSNEGQSDFT